MLQDFSGECLCGAVRYHLRAPEPRAMFLCHCTRCRRETGTVHGANVFFKGGELRFERGEERLTRFSLEGTRKTRVFCATCGSPMPRRAPGGRIVLPAGSLDDASALEPTAHIYFDDRAEWTDRLAETERHAKMPR